MKNETIKVRYSYEKKKKMFSGKYVYLKKITYVRRVSQFFGANKFYQEGRKLMPNNAGFAQRAILIRGANVVHKPRCRHGFME